MTEDESTAQRVAQAVREEVGNWMLGELNDAGLADAIWGVYEPFHDMSHEAQREFTAAVSKEIYG